MILLSNAKQRYHDGPPGARTMVTFFFWATKSPQTHLTVVRFLRSRVSLKNRRDSLHMSPEAERQRRRFEQLCASCRGAGAVRGPSSSRQASCRPGIAHDIRTIVKPGGRFNKHSSSLIPNEDGSYWLSLDEEGPGDAELEVERREREARLLAIGEHCERSMRPKGAMGR